MRFEFYAETVENCPVVLVTLISNTAVKRHLTMKLEGGGPTLINSNFTLKFAS